MSCGGGGGGGGGGGSSDPLNLGVDITSISYEEYLALQGKQR